MAGCFQPKSEGRIRQSGEWIRGRRQGIHSVLGKWPVALCGWNNGQLVKNSEERRLIGIVGSGDEAPPLRAKEDRIYHL